MAIVERKRKGKPARGRGRTFYEVVVWVSGVRAATRCFETKAEAHVWHERTKRRFESGKAGAGDMTLGQVVAEYERQELPGKTAGTAFRLRGKFRLFAESPIARVPMADFGGGHVDQLIEWLLEHPTAHNPNRKSFAMELKALGAVLGYYRDEFDDVFVSPVTRRHRKRALFKGAVPAKPKDHYLSAADAQRFFGALARQLDPVYHDLAMVQVIMGLRIGEAAGLRRDAVDFVKGTIMVKRTREWRTAAGGPSQVIANRTKTVESSRLLPMPTAVNLILMKALNRNPDALEVFRNRQGLLPTDSSIRHAYRRAFRLCGLPWTGTHICRDTNATLGILGGRMEAVQVNLGHTSARQTEGYARVHAVIENKVPQVVAEQLEACKKSSRG